MVTTHHNRQASARSQHHLWPTALLATAIVAAVVMSLYWIYLTSKSGRTSWSHLGISRENPNLTIAQIHGNIRMRYSRYGIQFGPSNNRWPRAKTNWHDIYATQVGACSPLIGGEITGYSRQSAAHQGTVIGWFAVDIVTGLYTEFADEASFQKHILGHCTGKGIHLYDVRLWEGADDFIQQLNGVWVRPQ